MEKRKEGRKEESGKEEKKGERKREEGLQRMLGEREKRRDRKEVKLLRINKLIKTE